jgi:hypothetical protein
MKTMWVIYQDHGLGVFLLYLYDLIEFQLYWYKRFRGFVHLYGCIISYYMYPKEHVSFTHVYQKDKLQCRVI